MSGRWSGLAHTLINEPTHESFDGVAHGFINKVAHELINDFAHGTVTEPLCFATTASGSPSGRGGVAKELKFNAIPEIKEYDV